MPRRLLARARARVPSGTPSVVLCGLRDPSSIACEGPPSLLGRALPRSPGSPSASASTSGIQAPGQAPPTLERRVRRVPRTRRFVGLPPRRETGRERQPSNPGACARRQGSRRGGPIPAAGRTNDVLADPGSSGMAAKPTTCHRPTVRLPLPPPGSGRAHITREAPPETSTARLSPSPRSSRLCSGRQPDGPARPSRAGPSGTPLPRPVCRHRGAGAPRPQRAAASGDWPPHAALW